MKKSKISIRDTGDNKDFKMFINNKEVDCTCVYGYELIRKAGQKTELILHVESKNIDIIQESENSIIKFNSKRKCKLLTYIRNFKNNLFK